MTAPLKRPKNYAESMEDRLHKARLWGATGWAVALAVTICWLITILVIR